MNKNRIIATVIIFLSIVFLPYWVYVPLLFLAIIFFPFFWEGVLYGFLIDAIYGEIALSFGGVLTSYGFWSVIVLMALLPIKQRIRNYA